MSAEGAGNHQCLVPPVLGSARGVLCGARKSLFSGIQMVMYVMRVSTQALRWKDLEESHLLCSRSSQLSQVSTALFSLVLGGNDVEMWGPKTDLTSGSSLLDIMG